MAVEYKVRKIERFIVTRHEEGVGSTQHGTFENDGTAYDVAYALCKDEHNKSGEPVGSMNFIYPELPANHFPASY